LVSGFHLGFDCAQPSRVGVNCWLVEGLTGWSPIVRIESLIMTDMTSLCNAIEL